MKIIFPLIFFTSFVFSLQPNLFSRKASRLIPAIGYEQHCSVARTTLNQKRFYTDLTPNAHPRFEKTEHGTTGAYFMLSTDDTIEGVFKRKGSKEEVLAYKLDIDHRAGVPHTDFATFTLPNQKRPVKGSLQDYIEHSASLCSRRSEDFDFDVDRVHAIGLLDLRIGNYDRNPGNLLFQESGDGEVDLLPIDHGYSMPESFFVASFSAWMYLNEAFVPFSEDTKQYVENLDVSRDTDIMRELGISESRIDYYEERVGLLKKCVLEEDMTLLETHEVFMNPGMLS